MPIWEDIFLAVALHLNVRIYLNFLLSCFNMEGFSFHVFIRRQKGRFVITLVPEHWARQVPACCLRSLTSVWHFIGQWRSSHSGGVAARPLGGGASLCGASLRLTTRLASAPCQLQESSLSRFWSLGSAEFLFCFPGFPILWLQEDFYELSNAFSYLLTFRETIRSNCFCECHPGQTNKIWIKISLKMNWKQKYSFALVI